MQDLGIEPSGFFVLRTPALPFDDFAALRGATGDGETTSERERLRAAVARPEVRDAVFVASPRIAELLERWLEEPGESVDRKLEHALVRYFSRMTTRSTPFGLFAGCSTGGIGDATLLQLGALEGYRRHTRLDMEYLSALVDELERGVEVRASLEYRPNSSLYYRGGKVCYAEARTDEGVRSHYLVAAADSAYLRDTIERASSGARPHELAEALVDTDVSLDEAQSFVNELIDSHILVSELTPPVTGDEPIEALIPTLERYPVTAKAGAALREVRAGLDEIDSRGVGVEPAAYLGVAAALGNLPATVALSRLFQVDMVKPAQGLCLGPRVVEEAARAVQILHRITGRTRRDDALGRFRNAFRDRYGDREVPLAEALDEELGIGFDASATPSAEASPLLAGLPFQTTSDDPAWRWRDQFLLGKVVEAARGGRDEIALTRQDLQDLASDPPPLPEAFSVGVTIAAASEQDVDAGDFELLFQGLYGPSGGRLMGRFCHADPEQHALLQEHLAQEEALHPEVAYAEIVHLPEGRLGNILLRPVLRSYEIPYLGRSGAPGDRQLPVQDLWVSVKDDRIVLRSGRLNREVWPRLTTAHNYTWRSLGVYRFLCALQAQGLRGALQWDWGVLEGAPFLPRVRAGRIVLARATWLVTRGDVRGLEEAGQDRWDEWRRERSIPRVVALSDADNELLVDWSNALSVQSFLALVRNRAAARLVEVWPREEELVVTGPEGRFRHEILIPFVSSRPSVPTSAPVPRGRDVTSRRSFPPGSEWSYAKLYTGTATVDAVLREHVAPLTRSWVGARAVDSWFFVRYGDPHWHVRLRLHGRPERLTHEVLPELEAVAGGLLEEGMIRSFQLDTYEREVERYGGPEGVELIEQIFHADSEACLAILTIISGDAAMDARWRLTLRGADLLLDDFGFSLREKSLVMRSLRDSFAEEFGASADLKRRIGGRYRQEKLVLEALLEDRASPDAEEALRLLHGRSPAVRGRVVELRELGKRGLLSRPLEDIASSVVHMHANRLLRSAARAQEMVIYDLLDRLYLARAKRGAP